MNNQEILDRVWDHFIVKRSDAGMDGDTCVYRSASGATCAVGCLIPADEKFSDLHSFSGDVETMLLVEGPLLIEALGKVDLRFLLDIQACHDNAALPPSIFHDQFEGRLRDMARTDGLTVPATRAESGAGPRERDE